MFLTATGGSIEFPLYSYVEISIMGFRVISSMITDTFKKGFIIDTRIRWGKKTFYWTMMTDKKGVVGFKKAYISGKKEE